jgi:hypothetical protein
MVHAVFGNNTGGLNLAVHDGACIAIHTGVNPRCHSRDVVHGTADGMQTLWRVR